jgi:hypothetical protein
MNCFELNCQSANYCLIALVGLEKTLQQPFYLHPPRGVAPSPDSHPQQQFPPLTAASPGVPSLSEKPASPTLGPFAVLPHSLAKVVARSTLPVGSPTSPPDHPLSDPAKAWSPAGFRRGRKQRDGTGPASGDPLTFSASRGQGPLNGTQTSPGRNSSSRAQNRILGHPKPSTPTVIPPRRGLRALLAPTPPQADGSVLSSSGGHPESPFCRPSNDQQQWRWRTCHNRHARRPTRRSHIFTWHAPTFRRLHARSPGKLGGCSCLPNLRRTPSGYPLGHPTGECHSSRDLHSRVSATCLSGGPSAVCDRYSIPAL